MPNRYLFYLNALPLSSWNSSLYCSFKIQKTVAFVRDRVDIVFGVIGR